MIRKQTRASVRPSVHPSIHPFVRSVVGFKGNQITHLNSARTDGLLGIVVPIWFSFLFLLHLENVLKQSLLSFLSSLSSVFNARTSTSIDRLPANRQINLVRLRCRRRLFILVDLLTCSVIRAYERYLFSFSKRTAGRFGCIILASHLGV